jgi:tRNA-splicing endonuclease subunit Sen2
MKKQDAFNKDIEWYQDEVNVEKFVLAPEEAFFLLLNGSLDVYQNGKKLRRNQAYDIFRTGTQSDCNVSEFGVRFAVYKFYRDKGWIVKSGILYGGDYGT